MWCGYLQQGHYMSQVLQQSRSTQVPVPMTNEIYLVRCQALIFACRPVHAHCHEPTHSKHQLGVHARLQRCR